MDNFDPGTVWVIIVFFQHNVSCIQSVHNYTDIHTPHTQPNTHTRPFTLHTYSHTLIPTHTHTLFTCMHTYPHTYHTHTPHSHSLTHSPHVFTNAGCSKLPMGDDGKPPSTLLRTSCYAHQRDSTAHCVLSQSEIVEVRGGGRRERRQRGRRRRKGGGRRERGEGKEGGWGRRKRRGLQQCVHNYYCVTLPSPSPSSLPSCSSPPTPPIPSPPSSPFLPPSSQSSCSPCYSHLLLLEVGPACPPSSFLRFEVYAVDNSQADREADPSCKDSEKVVRVGRREG